MDDLTAKLMEILSNKENLEKIKSLSSMLNNSVDEIKNDNSEEEKIEQPSQADSINDVNIENSVDDKVNDSINNNVDFNPDIIPTDVLQTFIKLMPLLSSVNKEDENTRLLYALRPHLSERRRVKLDESVKMMNMFKLLPVLKSQGIF